MISIKTAKRINYWSWDDIFRVYETNGDNIIRQFLQALILVQADIFSQRADLYNKNQTNLLALTNSLHIYIVPASEHMLKVALFHFRTMLWSRSY